MSFTASIQIDYGQDRMDREAAELYCAMRGRNRSNSQDALKGVTGDKRPQLDGPTQVGRGTFAIGSGR
jgi:hypothetical protein